MKHLRFALGITLSIVLLSFSCLSAQVKGIVVATENGELLAFTRIQNLRSGNGCYSGLNGEFSLGGISSNGDSLKFSLLGYFPKVVFVGPNDSMRIQLESGGINIKAVEINSDQNPALRIIRNTIENRQKNDPQKFENYAYESYNKIKAMPIYREDVPDSIRIKMPIFLTESFTKRQQYQGEKATETIESARLGGYPGKAIPFTATNLQDISFYQNYISVVGQQFLSPISAPGMRQYQFELLDVVVNGQDSIFQISFKPKNNKQNALEGQLRIHNLNWAISTAEATLICEGSNIPFKDGAIRQVYLLDTNGIWLPWQLYTNAITKPINGRDEMTFELSGFSEFSNHKLNVTFQKAYKPDQALILSDSAALRDSLLWTSRTIPLDSTELRSYHVMDSIGVAMNLNKLFDQSFKLSNSRIAVGPFDLVLEKFYKRNLVEKHHFGLGFSTNEKISKAIQLQANLGYGLGDGKFKYGARFDFFPLKNPRVFMGASYDNDLVESGFRRLGIRQERTLFQDYYAELGIRNWYVKNMEYSERLEFWLGGNILRGLAGKATWRIEQTMPEYDYFFSDTAQFQFSEVEAILHWAPGMKFAKQGDLRMFIENKRPVTIVKFTQGFDDQFGNFEYRALDFSFGYKFPAFRGGNAEFHVRAGLNDRPMPRSRMHVYRASYAPKNPTGILTSFNTMRYDEFAADVYAETFASIRPSLKWLRIGNSIKPKLRLSCAAAWGMLYDDSKYLHSPFPINAPDRIFLEPSIGITNIIPVSQDDNLISTFISGLGLSLSYRVGAYMYDDGRRNWVARLIFEL